MQKIFQEVISNHNPNLVHVTAIIKLDKDFAVRYVRVQLAPIIGFGVQGVSKTINSRDKHDELFLGESYKKASFFNWLSSHSEGRVSSLISNGGTSLEIDGELDSGYHPFTWVTGEDSYSDTAFNLYRYMKDPNDHKNTNPLYNGYIAIPMGAQDISLLEKMCISLDTLASKTMKKFVERYNSIHDTEDNLRKIKLYIQKK